MRNAQEGPAGRKRGARSRRRRLIIWAAAVLLGPPAGLALWCAGLRLSGNFHVVVPGKVYRSAQPSADKLRQLVRRYGLKTVVNLRGGWGERFLQDERDVLEAEGASFVYLYLARDRLPSADRLRALVRVVEDAPQPLLLHCRAGSDRTGLASVIAAMAVGGQDYSTARRQMSIRYGHVDFRAKTVGGVLDRYERYCRSQGLDTGGWGEFRRWAMTVYRQSGGNANDEI